MTTDRRGIVVTGASGFIGGFVLAHLKKAHPNATVLPLGGPSSKSFTPVDLTDARSVRDALGGFEFDTVVHLAAQSSVAGALNAPAAVWQANAVGAMTLSEVVGQLCPDVTMIHAGSAESYGASFLTGKALTEDAPLRPSNPYARSKVAAEMALVDILPAQAKVVLLRLFNHTGPGQDERFVAPSFAAQIARIEKTGNGGVLEVGDLSAERDFGHVSDAAAAIVSVIDARSGLERVSAFNVCSEVTRPVSDVLTALLASSTQAITVRQNPDRMRPSSIPVASGTSAALRAATGWRPQISFEQTMAEVLAYWRTVV